MTLTVIDAGIARKVQVFVACLPCSDLVYAEATWSQGQEEWLAEHFRAFAYLGGCPEKLVPDNTRTGVTEAHYRDAVLNRSYCMATRRRGRAVGTRGAMAMRGGAAPKAFRWGLAGAAS